METEVTIEPMSITQVSENQQKSSSINYSTTIPLEIPWVDAWEIIKEIVQICFPDDNVKLQAVTQDLAMYRYCFSVTGKIEPEALEVPINV